MAKTIIFLLLLLVPQLSNAQSHTNIQEKKAKELMQHLQISHTITPKKQKREERLTPTKGDEIKTPDAIEQMPSFPGGQVALMNYLNSNIKYPVIAEKNGVQGRVVIQFLIGEDGNIFNIEVVKSVDPSLDREAVRVIKNMPKWIPGKKDGKTVTVRYTLPVTFRLS